MAANWYNADGLNVKMHGEYDADKRNFVNRLKAPNGFGFYKQYIFEIDLKKAGASTTWFPVDRNNDGTNDGFTMEETFLPASSQILRAYYIATEAAAGGTDFTVGTYTEAGAAIDADGIIAATEGAIANHNAVGEIVTAAGALVGTTSGKSGLTANSWVAVTTNGTFTAGKGTLVIEVLPCT